MTERLSPLQSQVLNLARTRDLSRMTYREIGLELAGRHPYSIQQAVDGLIRKGYLLRNKKTKKIHIPRVIGNNGAPFLNIPVLGGVSCGVATEIAYDAPAGTITVTPSVVAIKHPERVFALVASGSSMTHAKINGKTVDPGDYVIVEKSDYAGVHDGDYVISRYNDMNNLKKIRVDRANRRYILLSESNTEIPPIIIAAEDAEYFDIEGIAIDVIKGVKV